MRISKSCLTPANFFLKTVRGSHGLENTDLLVLHSGKNKRIVHEGSADNVNAGGRRLARLWKINVDEVQYLKQHSEPECYTVMVRATAIRQTEKVNEMFISPVNNNYIGLPMPTTYQPTVNVTEPKKYDKSKKRHHNIRRRVTSNCWWQKMQSVVCLAC